MAHHELLTTQRNQVLAEIRDAGLNPAEFEWRDVVSDVTKTGLGSPPYTVQGIVHLPAGAGFVFDLDSRRGHHYAIFRPGRDGPSERINADTWFVALNYVREWLGLVKREYETPDLWAEIGQRRELLAGDLGELENTPFTTDEQGQIAAQLREISEYVRRTHDLSGPQQAALDSRLAYLEEASSRMGRIDWRNNFVGVMMGVLVEAILPQEVVREVVSLALTGLSHLFGFPDLGLPGG